MSWLSTLEQDVAEVLAICSIFAVVAMLMRWCCRIQLPVVETAKQWQLPMAVIAPEYEHLTGRRPRSTDAAKTVLPAPVGLPPPLEQIEVQAQQTEDEAKREAETEEVPDGAGEGEASVEPERWLLHSPGERLVDERWFSQDANPVAVRKARALRQKRKEDRERMEGRRRSDEEHRRATRIESLRKLSERGRPQRSVLHQR